MKVVLIIFVLTICILSTDTKAEVILGRDLFESSSRNIWLSSSHEDRIATLNELFKTMKEVGQRLPKDTSAFEQCITKEIKKPEYEGFDIATAIVKCQFKMGLVG